MRPSEIGDQLADGSSSRRSRINHWIVQIARGNSAARIGIHGGHAHIYLGHKAERASRTNSCASRACSLPTVICGLFLMAIASASSSVSDRAVVGVEPLDGALFGEAGEGVARLLSFRSRHQYQRPQKNGVITAIRFTTPPPLLMSSFFHGSPDIPPAREIL